MEITEELFAALSSSMSEGVVFQDADGRIDSCNQSAERLLGLTAGQMAGVTWMDPRWRAIHEDGSPFPGETHPSMITLRTGQPVSGVIMGVHKPDGTLTWISINSHAVLRDGKVRSVVATFTEHMRVSEERWKLAVEGARDGIWDLNPVTDEVFYSPRWKAILGYEEGEIGNTRSEWENRIHPDDKPATLAALNRHLDGDSPLYEAEYRLRCKDGTWKWLLARGTVVSRGPDGRPLRLVGALSDITGRKAAEKAREEAERQYREIFEGALEGIYRTSPQGKSLAANPALARILGYSSSEEYVAAVNDSANQVWLDPNERSRFTQMLEEQGVVRGYECQHKRKDGTPVWVSLNSRKVSGPEGKTLWYEGFIEDITERKRVEKAQLETEQRFRALAESSLIGVYVGQDGRCSYVNPAMAKIFGYGAEEMTRMDPLEIVQPCDRATVLENVRRRTAGEVQGIEFEFQGRRKDGSTRNVQVYGARVEMDGRPAIVGSLVDITEHKRAEEALRESEDKFKAVFRNSPDALYVATLEEGRILEVNDAFEPFFGYARQEVIGRTSLELDLYSDPDDRARVVAELQRSGRISGIELQTRKKSGEVFFTSMSIVTMMLRGEPHMVGALRDITAAKLAEERLRESEERFAAFMSHLPAAAFVKDEAGRTLFANRYLQELMGTGNWEAQPTACLSPGELGRRMEEDDRRALAQGPIKVRETVADSQGVSRTFETIKFPIRASGATTLLGGISIDITERERAEAALRAASRLNQQVIDSAHEGIIVYGPDLRFQLWNRFMEDMTGVAARDVIGRHPLELFPFLRECGLFERIEKVLASGLPETHDFRGPTAGWVSSVSSALRNEAGEIVGVIGTVRDINERKLSEERLRVSEERHRILFDSAPISLWEMDFSAAKTYLDGLVQAGVPDLEAHLAAHQEDLAWCMQQARALDMNRATLELFEGKDKAELLGSWTRVLTEESLLVCRKGLAALAAQQTLFRHEVALQTLTGRPLTCLMEVTPVPGAEGSWSKVLLSFGDITARKQAEEALRKSEEKFATLFRCSPAAVSLADVESGFRYLEVNGAFEQFTGYRREEAVGRTLAELKLWADRQEFAEALKCLRENSRLRGFEFRFRRKDGEIRTGLISMEPIELTGRSCVVIATIDITERRRAQQALQESTRQFLAVAKCIPDMIWSTDLSGRFTYVSPAAERLYGWTAEELLKLSYRDTTAPGQSVKSEFLLSQELERASSADYDRNRVLTWEAERLCKDGSTFQAEINASLVWSEDGKLIGVTGVTRDITERKRAEAEREKLLAQLAQAQKMESIGRLAGGMAHDFNNLLTVINGFSKLALSELPTGDPLRDDLEEILKAGERGTALTRQLLAFSRKQILQPRVLDMNGVVGDMRKMVERLMGEDVDVEFVLAAESPMVHADPHQLEQVILNLAANARDAMPDGGRLLVETALVEVAESYTAAHAEARAGRYATLAVSDTGEGMDEATRQRIFEPFFTTKGPGEGTGLGLSMVQGIVGQSGGFINVYSEPGRGTTFRIYLPALAGAPADEEKPAALPELRGKETILVVEDQDEVRRYAAAVLKGYGYRVMEAASAGEALLMCEREGARIHLVLTDVVMPFASGPELVTRLAILRPEIKALFMSGYTDNAVAHHEVLEEGAHFIQKPFSPEELVGKIRSVLGPAARAARILVADDEGAVRSFLRAALEAGGHRVTEAADGKEALKHALAGQTDLAIIDLIMPGQEGIETIRALRGKLPGLGIIAISGAFGGQFLKMAQMLGADAVLDKPVSAEVLLAKVAEVLECRPPGESPGVGG